MNLLLSRWRSRKMRWAVRKATRISSFSRFVFRSKRRAARTFNRAVEWKEIDLSNLEMRDDPP